MNLPHSRLHRAGFATLNRCYVKQTKAARVATRKESPELEQLRAFCLKLLDFVAEREGGPGLAAQARDLVMRCTRLDGIRMVTSDFVEMLQDLKGPELGALDARLSEAKLPTLTMMRSIEHRRASGILMRRRIRNDHEFNLLTSRLADVADTAWDEDERALASRLIHEYETRRSKT